MRKILIIILWLIFGLGNAGKINNQANHLEAQANPLRMVFPLITEPKERVKAKREARRLHELSSMVLAVSTVLMLGGLVIETWISSKSKKVIERKKRKKQTKERRNTGYTVPCKASIKRMNNKDDGFLSYTVWLRYPVDSISNEKGAFNETISQWWETKAQELYIEANLFNGEIKTGILWEEQTEENYSYWNDPIEAYTKLKKYEDFFIFNLSQLETVNAHQWLGTSPVTLRLGGNAIERGLWDIAGVDQRTGKRILFVRTHANRDDVFLMMNRLSILFNHMRTNLEPWQDDMQKASKAGYRFVSDVPEDEQKKMREGLEERIKAFGNPDWDWT